jgi:hypothetical protein
MCLRQRCCLYSSGSAPSRSTVKFCIGARLERSLGLFNINGFSSILPRLRGEAVLLTERQSDDTDEEWLPDIKDLIFGNYNVLIDLTGDSGSEVWHHVDGNQNDHGD